MRRERSAYFCPERPMILIVVWLIVAVVLGVAEVLTTSLAFGSVAVGALLAAGVGALACPGRSLRWR